jgi:predicted AlkP superfamily phosphohydrolase/phosphomutase
MTVDLAQAIHSARIAVGEHGLFALFSDAQPILVKQFVNLNNFLASMGIIDRNGPGTSIDWSNSLAYYMGHGQLHVNLLGRDSQGIVKRQQEYDEVCNILVEVLPQKLRDPHTDQPVIASVSRKEDFYNCDYLFCAPDLIVTFHPGYIPSLRSTYLDFDETIFTTPPTGTTAINGAHPDSINGFLIASAPAFKRGVTFTAAMPLTAIAPTLLHAIQAKRAIMHSDPQAECFDQRYLHTHPLHTTTQHQALSGEEEELILSRLRDLGYI